MLRPFPTLLFLSAPLLSLNAQDFPTRDRVLPLIWQLGMRESKALDLVQILSDSIGPRLTGSPGANAAHDWVSRMYASWGIGAQNVPYGTWTGWRRGPTHLDLVQPHARTLRGGSMSWSPPTPGPVEGTVLILPEVADSNGFNRWLPRAKGAFVLLARARLSCRPDRHFKDYGGPGALQRKKDEERVEDSVFQSRRIQSTGLRGAVMLARLEEAGALGFVQSTWRTEQGVLELGGTAFLRRVPLLELTCEDYGLLYRLAVRNQGPRLRAEVQAAFHGQPRAEGGFHFGSSPTVNTIAELRGSRTPREYILLSAHLDSYDGASGTTDNALGTAMVMEAMRILRTAYRAPRRTIIAGHWSGEEQGLNGSRAWSAANGPVVDAIHTGFNIDMAIGRVSRIPMQGLVRAGEYFSRWLALLPQQLTEQVQLLNPWLPTRTGADQAAFICSGAPVFPLIAADGAWDPAYTQHTWLDTFDKTIPEDLRMNATLLAMLVYLADQDSERMPRDQRVMPDWEGKPMTWPKCESGTPGWVR